jgi:hypothetical protein
VQLEFLADFSTKLDALLHYGITSRQNPPSAGFVCFEYLSCPLVSLALFGQFFPAFFRMNESVVRISQILFPLLADFAVAVPASNSRWCKSSRNSWFISACSSCVKLENSFAAFDLNNPVCCNVWQWPQSPQTLC